MRATIDWGFELLDPAPSTSARPAVALRTQVPVPAAAARSAGSDGVRRSARRARGVERRAAATASGTACSRSSASTRRRSRRLITRVASCTPRTSSSSPRAAEPELVGPDQGGWLERARGRVTTTSAPRSTGSRPRREASARAAPGDRARPLLVHPRLSERGAGAARAQASRTRTATPSRAERRTRSARPPRSPSCAATIRRRVSSSCAALALYRELGDAARDRARRSATSARSSHGLGELDALPTTLDECIAAAEALGERRLIALARNNRGDLALSQGRARHRRATSSSRALRCCARQTTSRTSPARSTTSARSRSSSERLDDCPRLLRRGARPLRRASTTRRTSPGACIALASVGALGRQARRCRASSSGSPARCSSASAPRASRTSSASTRRTLRAARRSPRPAGAGRAARRPARACQTRGDRARALARRLTPRATDSVSGGPEWRSYGARSRHSDRPQSRPVASTGRLANDDRRYA